MTNNHLVLRSKDSWLSIVILKVAMAALTLLLIAGSAHRLGHGETHKVAFELGAVDKQLPLAKLGHEILVAAAVRGHKGDRNVA